MRGDVAPAFDRAAALNEWSALYAAAAPNVFLSPPYVSAWLESAMAVSDIALLRVTNRAGRTAGLGFIGTPRRGSPLRPREARFLETGDPVLDRLYPEYVDILGAGADAGEVRDAAFDAILGAYPRVDEFVFRNAVTDLAQAGARAAAHHDALYRILHQQPTFQVNLGPVAGEGLAAEFTASLRQRIRRSMRRYAERGPVTFAAAETDAARAEAFETLMRLHGGHWRARGEPGAFAETRIVEFHQRLMRQSPHAVDLLRFDVNGEAVGVLYNFLAEGRAYNYQSGFQFENDNQLAPGFLCHALAIDRYRKMGLSIYDLMGGEADYKRRLGAERPPLISFVIERRGVRQQARSLARSFRRAGTRRT